MAATPKSKTKPAAKTPEASAAEASGAEAKSNFRIKELVEAIAPKTSVKKKDLRELTEVILAEVGAALDRGETLNLTGFGTLRVQRKTEAGALTLKLRRPDEAKQKKSKEALAEAGEAD